MAGAARGWAPGVRLIADRSGGRRAAPWPWDRFASTPGAMPGRVCRGRASAPWLRIRHAGRAPGKRRGSLHDRASRRRLGELHDHGVLQASYAPGKIAGPLGAVAQRQITAAYLRSLAKIAVQLACN